MEIRTQTYDQQIELFLKSMDWIKKDLDINLSSGRANSYLKTFADWGEHGYKSPNFDFLDFMNSLFEIESFISVYKAFQFTPKCQLQNIKSKMQKAVYGPTYLANETPQSNEARNFMFELLTASRLHLPHLLSTCILSSKSDTGVEFEGKKIWVECKRITSQKKLEKNIKVASSQLEKQIKNSPGSLNRGLIALDLTPITIPNDEMLVGQNEADLKEKINQLMNNTIITYNSFWQQKIGSKSKHILGFVIRLGFPAVNDSSGLLVNVSDWGIVPRNDLNSDGQRLLSNLANTL
ncbi:hypothetical protein [Pseudoteredinibacter isoporae]|uniref:hypothetical protein n=1 Tax=Pseudoteredinibacter isoporae TaxID=570281 RepID=UPI00310B175C